MVKKVVLAYSGGLDTSCILRWLLDQNYQVICYMANIGQDEDFQVAKQKALNIGANEVVIEDVQEDFVNNYVWPAIQMGLIYESRYLLGTSLARPCITQGLIKCAKTRDARYIAHGATAKGNDQVRFELCCYALWPEVQIIAPWRIKEFITRFEGRQDLIKYAKQNNIPVSVTPKAPWSMDANLMHISYESGILENPVNPPPKDLFQMTVSPQDASPTPIKLSIEFKNGIPIELLLGEKIITTSVDIFKTLNRVGHDHGVGRIDIVENRFIGLKSRGVYETPGGYILFVAHTDLEVFCLDKEVLRIKQYLRDRMADIVYNGFWFSPEAEFASKCIIDSQMNVTGKVYLEIYKGNTIVLGREGIGNSLYNEDLVSMDKHSDFNPEDATGFIKIQAIRLKEYNRCKK